MPEINSSTRILSKPIVRVLLPDSPDWDETGLLPADLANKPLSVEIPAWTDTPIAGLKSFLRVYWNTIDLVYEKDWEVGDWGGAPARLPPICFLILQQTMSFMVCMS